MHLRTTERFAGIMAMVVFGGSIVGVAVAAVVFTVVFGVRWAIGG